MATTQSNDESRKPAKSGDTQHSDKEKAALGAARRGEERANGPRDATRATPSTAREAAAKPAKDGDVDDPLKHGKGAGIQTFDPGGGDISPGG
jgi:hypothetical protein